MPSRHAHFARRHRIGGFFTRSDDGTVVIVDMLADNRGRTVGIYNQAAHDGSVLSRFLDERLPFRDVVVDQWMREIDSFSRDAIPPSAARDSVGWALELCIELDLARTPPRLWELSYLPVDRCAALLKAVGFEHRPVAALPASGASDPLLLHWVRMRRPVILDDAQRDVFAASLDLAWCRKVMHTWRDASADVRRSWFATMASDHRSFGSVPELLDALADCWVPYVDRGRRTLLALGDNVEVAPELGNGFGVADLVIGRTLVDVKLAIEPTAQEVAIWLRQLLGYVLLDLHDTFQLDTVAVYCGWQGLALVYPIDALLGAGSRHAPPSTASIRADFHEAMRADLDAYAASKVRERHSGSEA